jgi:type I restriction enzyme S subunit
MSEWKEFKFSDFVNISPSVKLETGLSYSFIEMADLSENKKYCVPKETRIFNGGGTRFQENDTLFARITPCLENGKICQVRNLAYKKGFGSTEFHVFRGKDHISNTDFIYYLSRWDEVRSYAEANLHGTSGRQRVPKEVFNNLILNLPSLPEQQAIAAVLSRLDDKIDLLHRQNKTLEAMAETIWRKMFIEDADPGWEEVSLLEIINLVGVGTPKTEIPEYWDGSIYWLSGKDITANHKSFVIDTEKKISELGLEQSSTKMLPKYATVISARGTVGSYCILSFPMAFSQTNYGVLPKVAKCYFFTYLLIAYVVEELKSASYGCVFDTITTSIFRDQNIVLPPEEIIISFEKIIEPYFNKIFDNTIQIRTLSRLRDTLLPKLMSGEVRVKV